MLAVSFLVDCLATNAPSCRSLDAAEHDLRAEERCCLKSDRRERARPTDCLTAHREKKFVQTLVGLVLPATFLRLR